MARIVFSDNTEELDLIAIQARLTAIGITLRHWPVPEGESAKVLLEVPSLEDAAKERLLQLVDHRFDELRAESGFVTRDLVVLYENLPGLAVTLGRFDRIHFHTDHEVRYVLAGSGWFGFVDASGKQFMLEVLAGDYINIPANTEHWFTLGDSARIKAVRYFTDTRGWTPVYTERAIHGFGH